MQAFDDLQRISASAEQAVKMMQVSNLVDVSAIAPQLRCPTLSLRCRGDRRIPFEEGRRLASLIPGARFVTLDSPNHVLLAEEPAWRRFLDEVHAFVPGGAAIAGSFGELTARERELLEYLARGLDNHQIAAHLALSEKTVR